MKKKNNIVTFTDPEPTTYQFIVRPEEKKETVYLSHSTEQKTKYCFVSVQTLERMKEIIDPVVKYSNHNTFPEEGVLYDLDEIVNDKGV